MYTRISNFLLTLAALFTLVACQKNNPQPIDATQMGQLTIEFDPIVGEENFALHPRTYRNTHQEVFTIRQLNYFVSNIVLTNSQGHTYVVPVEESYFLVKADDPLSRWVSVDVPEGTYTQVSFVLGVDSLRNTMHPDERKGVLSFNPEEGHDGGSMYWGWNSGYIFLKIEGSFQEGNLSHTSVEDWPIFRYHIGGFGGYSSPTFNNIKTITLPLERAGVAEVRKGRRSNIHLLVDVLPLFNAQGSEAIREQPQVMFSSYSTRIADRFPLLFSHDHTENFGPVLTKENP
jgi:hypothetical protein